LIKRRFIMNASHRMAAGLLATLGIGIANAAENNPLHPSYFWNKTQVAPVSQSGDGWNAAPITNPLHPGYFAARASAVPFTATGARQTGRYVDERNPLHPSYRRL
jgi:hypothetical protein